MNETTAFEQRNSVDRFLKLHVLVAAQYLRFLQNKELGGEITEWWKERAITFAALIEVTENEIFENIGFDSNLHGTLFAKFEAIVTELGGEVQAHKDPFCESRQDIIFCAGFRDDSVSAFQSADKMLDYFEEAFVGSQICCTTAIGVNELRVRWLLETATKPDCLNADKDCWDDLKSSKKRQRFSHQIMSPNLSEYRQSQDEVLSEMAGALHHLAAGELALAQMVQSKIAS
jgi:hypothetical protein